MACRAHATWRCRHVVRIARLPACSSAACTPCCSTERLLCAHRRLRFNRKRGCDRWSTRQCHHHSHDQGRCARDCRGTASGALPHAGASAGRHWAGACKNSAAENSAHARRSRDRNRSVRDQGCSPHTVVRYDLSHSPADPSQHLHRAQITQGTDAGSLRAHGNIPDAWIAAQVAQLNAAYSKVGFTFALMKVTGCASHPLELDGLTGHLMVETIPADNEDQECDLVRRHRGI